MFWHMQLYMSWYIRPFFGFTFLNILYFFKSYCTCTNTFQRRNLYTFYHRLVTFRYIYENKSFMINCKMNETRSGTTSLIGHYRSKVEEILRCIHYELYDVKQTALCYVYIFSCCSMVIIKLIRKFIQLYGWYPFWNSTTHSAYHLVNKYF